MKTSLLCALCLSIGLFGGYAYKPEPVKAEAKASVSQGLSKEEQERLNAALAAEAGNVK